MHFVDSDMRAYLASLFNTQLAGGVSLARPEYVTNAGKGLWIDATAGFILKFYNGLTDLTLDTFSAGTGVIDEQFDVAANTTFAPYFASTQTVRFKTPSRAITITGISLVTDAAVATDANDRYAFAVQNGGTAGTGTTSVATGTTNSTGGVAIVAQTAYPLTLSVTAANLIIAAGEQLKIVCTKTGSPTALATSRIYLILQYRTN